jgi:hypothetical protein
MGERELSAEASEPEPTDDFQDLLKLVPLGLAIDINATSESYMIRVLGRGWNRGPAVIFSVFAVFLSIATVIAAARAVRHEEFAALYITAFGAVALWLPAICRGRVDSEFQITRANLNVSQIAPLVGCLRRSAIAWREIERIAVEAA